MITILQLYIAIILFLDLTALSELFIILSNARLHVSYFVRICTSGSENRALASFQRGVLKNFGNKSIHRIKFKFLVLFFIRL